LMSLKCWQSPQLTFVSDRQSESVQTCPAIDRRLVELECDIGRPATRRASYACPVRGGSNSARRSNCMSYITNRPATYRMSNAFLSTVSMSNHCAHRLSLSAWSSVFKRPPAHRNCVFAQFGKFSTGHRTRECESKPAGARHLHRKFFIPRI
jgi:hypothetical protein